MDDDGLKRARLLLLLGRGLHRAGLLTEAGRTLSSAGKSFGDLEPESRAMALAALAETLYELGEPGAMDAADRALASVKDTCSLALVEALQQRAMLYVAEDSPSEALAKAEAALSAARELGLEEPPRALEVAALSRCLLGDVDTGLQRADRLLDALSGRGAAITLGDELSRLGRTGTCVSRTGAGYEGEHIGGDLPSFGMTRRVPLPSRLRGAKHGSSSATGRPSRQTSTSWRRGSVRSAGPLPCSTCKIFGCCCRQRGGWPCLMMS